MIAKDQQFLYRPALIRVGFGKKSLSDVKFRLSPKYRRADVTFLTSEIADIDPEAHTVITRDRHLGYDNLLVALSEHLAYEEIPGLKAYGFSTRSPGACRRP